MADIKDTLKDAAHKVADTAKDVGHKIADGASQAADWVKDKAGLGEKAGEGCGPAKSTADIKPHMQVISSCGCKMGSVDHLEGGAIKLTQKDSPDGLHHYVPVGWVARVDEHVHLSKNSTDTKRDWKPTAAGCVATAG